MEDQFRAFQQRLRDLVYDAINKNPEHLTAAEKMAICFLAGVGVDFVPGDEPNRWIMRTRNPCAILKLNGRFEVRERI